MPPHDTRARVAARPSEPSCAASVERRSGRHQAEVRMVLKRRGNRALDLRERGPVGLRDLAERAPKGARHERVGLLAEREGPGLACGADDAPGGTGEAHEMLVLAAVGAGPELRREACREQQLQAEGKGAGAAAPGAAPWAGP